MKGLIKRALEVFGHALTVSVHKRLDHHDHALDLVIDQNNRMARTQTALLQSSIHTVNTLNRMQADLNGMKRGVSRLAGRSDRLVEAIDRMLIDVTELKNRTAGQIHALDGGGETAAADE